MCEVRWISVQRQRESPCPPSKIPDSFRLRAEIPKAGAQQGKEDRLVHGIPEVFKEAGIEVDKQKRQPKSLGHSIVISQTMIDSPAGRQPEEHRPVE